MCVSRLSPRTGPARFDPRRGLDCSYAARQGGLYPPVAGHDAAARALHCKG